jgi:hypothetical protein
MRTMQEIIEKMNEIKSWNKEVLNNDERVVVERLNGVLNTLLWVAGELDEIELKKEPQTEINQYAYESLLQKISRKKGEKR